MLVEMGKRARQSARVLGRANTDLKNVVLMALADELLAHTDAILAANAQDVADGQQAGLTPALIDRLTLNPSRMEGIANELRNTASLPDPIGEIIEETSMPNGLRVRKQRVQLGVVGVIYEARPNVTVDVAGLALKSGNAAILRGGSETLRSNRALVSVIREVLTRYNLPADAVQFIDDPDRARVMELLQLSDYVDILIPRGGPKLHEFCRENSRIPVITGGIGICHLFVDESADLEASIRVIHNAKTQRPSVCNALDTVLIHRNVAADFLPDLVDHLQKDGVSFRVDAASLEFLAKQGVPASVTLAGPEDFDTEWLALILGLRVVSGLEEAIAHIEAHSTGHSDGILTRDQHNAERFIAEIDSAAVYVNASTRFTDGSQLGLGAEVAISTQRLHARGPMALRELTTYKWVIIGDNHVRP
ncbi:MAG: glutamate-5-semialdehyde dehydrogenase [Anaerolineales bacterium]